MFPGELRLEVHRDGENQHVVEQSTPCTCFYMWQSRVHYSVAYFDCVTAFKAL